MDEPLARSWVKFKYYVKHYERFFDFGGLNESRSAILEPITRLLERLVITLRAGERVWRARRVQAGGAFRLPWDMGPAPHGKASNNRMSPQGISYMYASDRPEVCVAEIRPAVGETVCLGEFEMARDLSIVDLSGVSPRRGSRDVRAARFLASFAREISRPVLPGDEMLDYIPTQVLSEFIRSRGYQGIKYRSSQSERGFNYTLFCGPGRAGRARAQRPRTSIAGEPFDRWMTLVSVERFRVVSALFALEPVEQDARPASSRSSQ